MVEAATIVGDERERSFLLSLMSLAKRHYRVCKERRGTGEIKITMTVKDGGVTTPKRVEYLFLNQPYERFNEP